jgi:hypothetical protein
LALLYRSGAPGSRHYEADPEMPRFRIVRQCRGSASSGNAAAPAGGALYGREMSRKIGHRETRSASSAWSSGVRAPTCPERFDAPTQKKSNTCLRADGRGKSRASVSWAIDSDVAGCSRLMGQNEGGTLPSC